jgi:hypothetical protein
MAFSWGSPAHNTCRMHSQVLVVLWAVKLLLSWPSGILFIQHSLLEYTPRCSTSAVHAWLYERFCLQVSGRRNPTSARESWPCSRRRHCHSLAGCRRELTLMMQRHGRKPHRDQVVVNACVMVLVTVVAQDVSGWHGWHKLIWVTETDLTATRRTQWRIDTKAHGADRYQKIRLHCI